MKNRDKGKPNVMSNALLNMVKQACTIVFPLITFPYASRVLGVENYGKVSFVNSVISYVALLAGLGISTYAVREGAQIRNNPKKINEFVNEVFSINVCSTIISLLALTLVTFSVEKIYSYKKLILIYSLSVILTAVGSDWVNTIFEDFRYITIRYIVIQLLCLIPIFLFVKNKNDYYIYTIILVLSGYGGNLLNLGYIRKYVRRKFTFKLNLKKHLKPILILFSSMVAVRIYLNSDVTMIGLFKGDVETGVYGAVSKIYTLAKELINAITIAMIPRVANLLNENDGEAIKKLSDSTVRLLITLILPMTVGISILSPDIITVVNGAEYVQGSLALQILSVALPFAVLSCFFSNAILIPYSNEKIYLIATSAAALVNIVLNVFFIDRWGMNGAATTTVLAELIVFIIVYQNSKKVLCLGIMKMELVRILIGCFIVCVVCLLSRTLIVNVLLRIIAAVSLSVISYFAFLKLMGYDILKIIRK